MAEGTARLRPDQDSDVRQSVGMRHAANERHEIEFLTDGAGEAACSQD